MNVFCDETGLSDEIKEFYRFLRTGEFAGRKGSLTDRLNRAVEDAVRTGKWSVDYMRYEEEMKHRVFMETQEINKKLEEAEARATTAEARATTAEARAEVIAADKDREIKDRDRTIKDRDREIEDLERTIKELHSQIEEGTNK